MSSATTPDGGTTTATDDAGSGSVDGSVDDTKDSGGSPSAPSASCALTLFTPDYPATCQAALDGACCDEERACAADVACKKIVDCVGACPRPRTDACLNACAGDGSGATKLEAIAACSKKGSFDAGTECDWPR